MAQRILVDSPSSAGGELSAWLTSRRDLERYSISRKRVENMVVLPEGVLTRRSGTQFVDPIKNEAEPACLIDFAFSPTDNLRIVLNAGVARFYRNGGVLMAGASPYEKAVPFAGAELDGLRWFQIGDVLFFARGAYGKPIRMSRVTDTNWTIDDYPYALGPVEPQNVDKTKTIQASAATGTGITLTAVGDLFLAAHVGTIWRLDEFDLSAIPIWLAAETVSTGNKRRNGGRIYEVIAGTDTGPNPPTHEEGDVLSGQGKVTWRFVSTTTGYVKVTAVAGPTSATADVLQRLPDGVVSAATYRWHEPAWSDAKGWPDRVHYHDQALCWFRGDTVWKTKPGDLYTFDIDGTDGNGLVARLTTPDGTLLKIEWALSAAVIVIGASNGEYVIRGASAYDALSVTNLKSFQDAGEGSAPQRVLQVDGGAFAIGRSRKKLHHFAFDRLSERIEYSDATRYMRGILRGKVQHLAWQKDPNRLVWGHDDAGRWFSLTFYPKEKVVAPARHPMVNGAIEQICGGLSPDGTVGEIWMIVRRVIDGQTRRYIERLMPFFEPADADDPTAEGAWFVDCGLRYDGPATTTITGLTHLKGQTVRVLAGHARHPDVTVDLTGRITLQRPATPVLVGLPLQWAVETLPVETETREGPTLGDIKRSTHCVVEVLESFGGRASCNGGRPEALFPTGAAPAGTPPRLFSGQLPVKLESPAEPRLTVRLEGDDAFPFTLLAIAPDLQIGGK